MKQILIKTDMTEMPQGVVVSVHVLGVMEIAVLARKQTIEVNWIQYFGVVLSGVRW